MATSTVVASYDWFVRTDKSLMLCVFTENIPQD